MSWQPDEPEVAASLPNAAESALAADTMAHDALANSCLRLELSAAALLRLLIRRQLCAADFRCLDCESKHCVWRLLLMSSAKTLQPAAGYDGQCARCEDTKQANPETTSHR